MSVTEKQNETVDMLSKKTKIIRTIKVTYISLSMTEAKIYVHIIDSVNLTLVQDPHLCSKGKILSNFSLHLSTFDT